METVLNVNSPLQKKNFGNSHQKLRKSGYQSFSGPVQLCLISLLCSRYFVRIVSFLESFDCGQFVNLIKNYHGIDCLVYCQCYPSMKLTLTWVIRYGACHSLHIMYHFPVSQRWGKSLPLEMKYKCGGISVMSRTQTITFMYVPDIILDKKDSSKQKDIDTHLQILCK